MRFPSPACPRQLTHRVQSDSGLHHHSSHHRRNSDSLGERFRRWFGGLGHHHSGSREYVDARTGQPVDRSGRPIYRV